LASTRIRVRRAATAGGAASLLTLQGPASTIVNMDSSGDPPHTAQVLRDELGVTGAEREELTKACVADKHPEAGQ
jgi:hypothetical protein